MRSGHLRERNMEEAALLKTPPNLKVDVWLHFAFKKNKGSEGLVKARPHAKWK